MNRLLLKLALYNQIDSLSFKIEEKEQELKDRWQNSKNLPRKKKKAERKHILLDYSINQYAKTLI